MGLLDEWDKVKKSENIPADRRKWALTKGSPKDKKPYIESGGTSRLSEDIIKAAVTRNTETAADRQPKYANKMLFDEANYKEPPPPSPMELLMERISAEYQPIMPPGGSPNDEIMKRLTGQLDETLTARLGAIGNARKMAQQGYDISDKNLAAMFGANANNIATQGSQRFGEIAQEHKAGLTGLRDESINRLSTDRNNAMAQREAMLQRLGIEAAAGQADPREDTYNSAISDVTRRSATALEGAESRGNTNQAYNQSVVNSVNQQGTERRAALLQQLQAIQGELGRAEAEAQGQNAQQKAQLEMQQLQSQGQGYADANKFGYQQFKDDRNLAFDLYKTMLAQDKQGQNAPQERVQGYAGLGTDLMNQGIPEAQVGQYMASLSEVLGSDYLQGVHPDDGYSRADIITRKLTEPPYNYPPYIAAMLANNQQNLGNNAYYTAK